MSPNPEPDAESKELLSPDEARIFLKSLREPLEDTPAGIWTDFDSIGDEFSLESMEEKRCEFGVRYTALMMDGSEIDKVIPCEQNVYVGRKLKEVETAKENDNG